VKFNVHCIAKVILILISAFGCGVAVSSTIVDVPGTASPWLAGAPNGTLGIPEPVVISEDISPDNSPVLVSGIDLSAAKILTFSVSGLVDFTGLAPQFGPDGAEAFGPVRLGSPASIPLEAEGDSNYAISDFRGLSGGVFYYASLLGVFINENDLPQQGNAPDTVNRKDNCIIDFTSLRPKLNQVFPIGDGRRDSDGKLQKFIVPQGATHLYLGVMDGFRWRGNTGSFSVTIDTLGEQSPPIGANVDYPRTGKVVCWDK